MKIFLCEYGEYEEITTKELQDRIEHIIGIRYVIEEITDECIYVCEE